MVVFKILLWLLLVSKLEGPRLEARGTRRSNPERWVRDSGGFTSMVAVGREKTKICNAFGCRKIVLIE